MYVAIRTRRQVGLRAAPVLVHRLHLLGAAQRGAGSFLASITFRPRLLQGRLEPSQAHIRLRRTRINAFRYRHRSHGERCRGP